MRRLLLVSMIVVVVLVSGAGGYLLGARGVAEPRSTTSGLSGFSLPASVCSAGPPPPANLSMIDVYQIAPASVAVICVNYHFARAGTATFTPSYGPYSSGSYTACGSANGTIIFRCPDLNITASLYTFEHPANQNVTVAYTIVTGKNITGVWWFFIASCDVVPLVFGEVPPSVGAPMIFGCVMSSQSPTSATVTGYWNANVSLVRG